MTQHAKPPVSRLVHRMADSVAPLPKRGIEEVHKTLVKRLRRYRIACLRLAFS